MAKSLALLIVAAGAAAAAAGAVRGQSPDSPASPSASQTASVYLADGKYSIKLGVFDKAAVAYGNYTDMADNPISLFGTLDIETNPAFADTEQTFAAGFLEGAVTQGRIKQQFVNMQTWWLGAAGVTRSLPTVFEEWFAKQDSWARQQVAAHPHDSYWQHVDTVLHQLDGLVAGYAAVAPPSEALTRFNLAALNGVGDLIDLLNVLMPSTRPAWEAMAPEEVMRTFHSRTHCSSLVRVTGDFSELFQGHSSWFVFQGMLRIMKSYHFQLANPTTGSHDTTFSSYPGYLSSLDDFYTNFESGIIMTQTTNNIFNHSLYSLVVPESLLAWQRVRLANQIATSGAQWMEIAATHNSGTYNNAYLVTDLKKWTAKAALVPGLFTYGEQIPGEFQWQDTTETLAQSGFWASYNVPYFRDIYEKSGYASIVQAHAGNETSAQVLSGLQYQMAPRAKIVRRQAGAIADMVDYKAFMRFNEFKSDPYAAGNPFAAICSRGDLAATHASTSGCYDTKVTSASWFQEYKAQIVNGPTWGKWSGKDNLPAFSWSEQGGKFAGLSHEGMPDTFATDFVDHTPQWREW